ACIPEEHYTVMREALVAQGETLVEQGRFFLYHAQKYIIETKIFTDAYSFAHGKQQLAGYLISEGIDEGFLVVFTQKHTAQDTLFFDENINGKRIRTYLIRTNFDRPSRRSLDKPTEQ
ncbi:MAG: hypothetical protein KDE19_05950, partial [Caldilineaceae bacterium]|nr:hypothetical protein [Caldilineaceae bacterium]